MTSTLLQHVPHPRSPATHAVTVGDLAELMRGFNEVSSQLQSTQTALHAEVARLKSELAEANAQIRRSRALAALGEMAAGIAHEIRNPLACIQLYTQSLVEELGDAPAAHALCVKIRQAVGHMDAVVRDVLNFARDRQLRLQDADAFDLLDRALETCWALVHSHAIEVRIDARQPCAFVADDTLLIQALGNLMRNAIEALVESNASSRVLRLTAHCESRRCTDRVSRRCVVFVVEDSGPGIPADVIDRMFNPFFTTRKTGTGLGLAIVHRIVDAHGGHISVGSADHASGARLELCIPTEMNARSLLSKPSHDAAHNGIEVHDDCAVHTLTQDQAHAGDGIRRLARSRKHEPDTCCR